MNDRGRNWMISYLAMAWICLLVPDRAEAQWGYGFGWGSPAFNYVPSPTDFLNQRALVAGSRSSGPTSNNVYAGSSNSYFNNIRDNSGTFGGSYDFQTRRSASEARIARSARAIASAAPAPAPAPATGLTSPRPADAPITSFFNRDEVLVWPADAPISGELGPKRATSDEASLAVLHEYTRQGLAQIATATEARNKLLAYGRPALRTIRERSTTRVADTFHQFMLSLYESLARATTAPKPAGS